jgi:hydrogenase maturation protease
MTRVRIIGIGSPFGDDRVGWDAVEALAASGLLKRYPAGTVDACCCDRPGSLLALLRDVDVAIVIDAMRCGVSVGTVRKLAAHELAPPGGVVSSHGISVAENIALGRALSLLPPTLLLYGIEALRAAPATEPDQEVRAAIPELLDAIALDLEYTFATIVAERVPKGTGVSATD